MRFRKLALVLTTALVGAAACVATTGTQAAAAPSWCGAGSKIVILGDSSTTGYGSTGYDEALSNGYQSTTWGWSARMERRLASTTKVINLGINGGLTSDFLVDGKDPVRPAAVPTAVARIKAEKPKLVVIALGGNEYSLDRSPSSVYKVNLAKLRDRIKYHSPNSELLYVHTWQFSYRYGSTAVNSWSSYATQMKAVAGTSRYLDLTRYLPKSDDGAGGLYIKDEYGPNLAVHPTDAGHGALFAAYWSALKCS